MQATTTVTRNIKPLTDRTVAALKAEAGRRIARPDGDVPGLAIRVSPSGRKTWALTYRVGRRQRRWTIGTYPVITLASARKKARRALTDLEDGIDPSVRKRAGREYSTFEDLATAYVKHAKVKKRSWAQDALLVRSVLLPAWKHRPVTDIKRRNVKDLLAGIVERGKPVMANRVQALISTMFNYAVREEWLDTGNPAALIEKQPETSRNRVLTHAELRSLWSALDSAKRLRRIDDGQTRPAIAPMIARGLQVQLLTAQRGGEVFQMQWGDLELQDGWEDASSVSGWWTIPASVAKNKQAHRVPLVPRVVDLLREAKAEGPTDNRWVFGGDKGGSVAARALKAMRALRQAGAIQFDIHRHDLRRTASTEMGRAGVARATIAHVLNHVDRGSRATQIYDRYDHDSEKRAVLELWSRRLDEVLGAKEVSRILPFANREVTQAEPVALASSSR